ERMPLDRMEQDKTKSTWKRDGLRDINKALLEFDHMMLDMKLSKTYSTTTVSSSQENAVTATALTSRYNGTYSITVENHAASAMKVSKEGLGQDFDLNGPLEMESNVIRFSTYDENGEEDPHKIPVDDGDTLNDVLKRINDSDSPVRAFYHSQSNRVIMETTRTGQYNPNDGEPEIVFDNEPFFTETLNMTGEEKGGTNAEFVYNNGITMESKTNSYELNGVRFEFKNVT